MGENKGPFYSFNPAYHNMELHKACQDCKHLQMVPHEELNDELSWVEPVCSQEVCPKLGDIRKGG